MGHEYVGIVEEIGADVKTLRVGDFVVGSFVISDNTCEICREERGDDGVTRIKELTNGLGVHSVIEAVGTQEAMMQAIGATRGGGHLGYVGVPQTLPLEQAAEGYKAMDERRAIKTLLTL